MSAIAFIGLGIMGSPMAVHLQNAGHQVAGYNKSPGKAGPLVGAGGQEASSIADAVKGAEVVAVMVPDSPDVEAVLTDDDGVFAAAAPGTLVIDFSSIRPDVTAQLADVAAKKGFRLLDAPVSGGEAGAKNAALSIMVGGTAEDFAAAKPILDTVGKTVVHNTRCPRMAEELAKLGYRSVEVELDEFLKAGGSAKCLTLRLDGEEAAVWE